MATMLLLQRLHARASVPPYCTLTRHRHITNTARTVFKPQRKRRRRVLKVGAVAAALWWWNRSVEQPEFLLLRSGIMLTSALVQRAYADDHVLAWAAVEEVADVQQWPQSGLLGQVVHTTTRLILDDADAAWMKALCGAGALDVMLDYLAVDGIDAAQTHRIVECIIKLLRYMVNEDTATDASPPLSLATFGRACDVLMQTHEGIAFRNLVELGDVLLQLRDGIVATHPRFKAMRTLEPPFGDAVSGYLRLLAPEVPLSLQQFALWALTLLLEHVERASAAPSGTELNEIVGPACGTLLLSLPQNNDTLQMEAARLMHAMLHVAQKTPRVISPDTYELWLRLIRHWCTHPATPQLQLQSALCLRTLSNHPQTRQQLSASSDTMDALLQFARQMHQELEQLQASIETTASTTEIQRHLSATVRNLCTTSVRTADIDLFRASSSPRSSSTLHSTRSLPMSTVFQATHDLMDLPVFGADEYEATTEFGWIDMLTAWTASADSQVRANAINSLVHIVEHEDSEADENVKNGLAKKELILQAWLMSMLQHLRNVSPDEELLAVREVERIAELADDLTPGNEAIQFNPAAVDAGVAALAIMAECHHEELISRGVLPLLSLLSTKGRVEEFDIHSQCARVIANLAAKCCEVVAAQYVHPPTNPADKQQSLDERHWDLMHLDIENLMRQSTSGRRFLATLKTWPKHEDPMRRSSYYRAIQNMRAYHSLVRDGHISTTVYREGIHPIVPRKHDNDIALVGECDDGVGSYQTAEDHSAHEEDWDVDIVFVHGLRGHPFGTWRTDMSSDIEGDNDIWPDTLLQEDLRRRHINARLITLGYEAGMMSWSSPWPSLSLEERARLMLQGLYDANIGQNNCADKPARPVIFITHSMGGLLVKKMLLQANQNLQSKSGANVSSTELVDSIRGVVFLAVPHFGSDLAKGMSSEAIRSLIRAHPALRDLCSKNRQLRDLNLAFQDLGIDCFSVAEDKPAHLALGISALVVKPTSANPGFGKFQILDDSDHMSICKAKSVDDPLYQLIAGYLLDKLQRRQQQATHAFLPDDVTIR